MNSDYIPRLRSELLRAGATEQARWRPARTARVLRPLAAAAAVVLVAVAVVLAVPDRFGEETAVERPTGTIELSYRVEPAAAQQAAQVMRERLSAAGIPGAGVSVSSGGLTIRAPAGAGEDVSALTKRGRLAIYDWERSVLGPRGVSAPADTSVTGGPDAGGPAAAISEVEAEARASGRPGGQVVHARSGAPEGWFALGGDPALTNADIARAESTTEANTQDPIVELTFTARGQTAFAALTRELAHRGNETAADGVSPVDALQHLAIVLDDRIVSVPFIDFRQAPDGIDGAAAMQISGDLTPETARRVAALLNAGPLPADLVPDEANAGGG